MQTSEYENIFKHENAHWWYRSTQNLVFSILKKFRALESREASVVLLDTGCGTGGMLRFLKKRCPGLKAIGLDYSPDAIDFCRKGHKAFSLVRGSVDSLPFESGVVDVIVCADVLYHSGVPSDYKALKEMCRVLRKGGYLFIHLPAFEFLRGSHDNVVHTRERYTAGKLRDRVKSAGFRIIKSGYRNTLLFPFIYAKRISEKYFQKRGNGSDLKTIPPLINNILKGIISCENNIVRHFDLPIGSSVICLARKNL